MQLYRKYQIGGKTNVGYTKAYHPVHGLIFHNAATGKSYTKEGSEIKTDKVVKKAPSVQHAKQRVDRIGKPIRPEELKQGNRTTNDLQYIKDNFISRKVVGADDINTTNDILKQYHDFDKSRINGSMTPDEIIFRERLANAAIGAIGYNPTNILDNYRNNTKGELKEDFFKIRNNFFRLYSGLPQDTTDSQAVLRHSPYKPSKAVDDNAVYATFDGLVPSINKTGKAFPKTDEDMNTRLGITNTGLGHVTYSKVNDETNSIYDKWDLNPIKDGSKYSSNAIFVKPLVSPNFDINQYNNPIEIYNRFSNKFFDKKDKDQFQIGGRLQQPAIQDELGYYQPDIQIPIQGNDLYYRQSYNRQPVINFPPIQAIQDNTTNNKVYRQPQSYEISKITGKPITDEERFIASYQHKGGFDHLPKATVVNNVFDKWYANAPNTNQFINNVDGAMLGMGLLKAGIKSAVKRLFRSPKNYNLTGVNARDYVMEFARQSSLKPITKGKPFDTYQELIRRANTPEGVKRADDYYDFNAVNRLNDNTKLRYDDHNYAYNQGNIVGVHPALATSNLSKGFTRHELEHRLQNGFKTSIDESLENLELLKTPVKLPNDGYRVSKKGKMSDSKALNVFNDFANDPRYKQSSTNYFTYGSDGKEKSPLLSELQQYMLDKKLISHAYAKNEITPAKIKKIYSDYLLDKDYPLRIFDIMKPTKDNFKLIADNLNKMLTPAAGILGTQQLYRDKK